MTRVVEHRGDDAADEEVFELRVFQLRDGDVRGCIVPADVAVNLDLMADMSEPVAHRWFLFPLPTFTTKGANLFLKPA
jgi:hypothetical protein